MNHYNDRALVSRILIPAILNDWRSTNPGLSNMFAQGLTQVESGNIDGLGLIESALSELPESIGLKQIRHYYPSAWEECSRAFPSLIRGLDERVLWVRKRALHHIQEVKRVAQAREILNLQEGREAAEPSTAGEAMGRLGRLLSESHSSLRDLYEVSTPEIEEMIGIIETSRFTSGARMMGGGFGGNILALAPQSSCAALIELAQQKYYLPRGRDGLREGSIMVSTPGLGISEIA